MASPVQTPAASAVVVDRSHELMGHPTCLFTLFFAEMWERFSFYGMKALLILYLVNYLFWRQDEASNVMKWYTMLVYATPILGGLVADRWIGARWSVVIGGVLIAIGHTLLAFEPMPFFYSGLGFLIVGVGFLKPNISTQVGALYRSNDPRRDSAFTLFYMGINMGAFFGPIICDWLRLNYGWHYGFGAAGVGMVIGLIVYIAGMGSVVRRSRQIAAEEAADPTVAAGHDKAERHGVEPASAGGRHDLNKIYFDRSLVLVVLCVFAILFWVGFEQAANVMNVWADQHTNLHVFRASSPEVQVPPTAPASAPAAGGWSSWQMGAAMTQSINPMFIILFALVFAWLWQALERKKMQPSTPTKMAFGVFFLSLAYGILLLAVQGEGQSTSAPLANLPPGLKVDEQNRVYSTYVENEQVRREYYGATRLTWAKGTLHMNGVLPDTDWMRALGASATAEYRGAIEQLEQNAAKKNEEVRAAKRAGQKVDDAWAVRVEIPAGAGTVEPIAGLPMQGSARDMKPVASWSADERAFEATAELSRLDRAKLVAAGADPAFRDALTAIYRQSSTLRVSVLWLFAFYLILTIGELCLSPVGLSLVTKAAPPKLVGLFMGLWFLTTGAVANFFAHFAGGYWGTMTPAQYFMIFGVLGIVATVIMLMLIRVLKPRLHGIN